MRMRVGAGPSFLRGAPCGMVLKGESARPSALWALRGRLAGNSLRKGRALKLPRRRFLCGTGGAVALATLPPIAPAQTYPSGPVHLIEGFGAASTAGML